MPVVKFHDINRWIVKVPLIMASSASDGPCGGMSVTVAKDAEVVEVAPVATSEADGEVAPKTTPGKKTKGKGKTGESLLDDTDGALEEDTGDVSVEKPAKVSKGKGRGKGRGKAVAKAASKKRPAACDKGGPAKTLKRPAAAAADATAEVVPPPDVAVTGGTTPGPTPAGATTTAIVPHVRFPPAGDPKYRDVMKARRFQQLWAQRALPAECMQLIEEATAAKGRGDNVYYQSGYFLEPPGFYLV